MADRFSQTVVLAPSEERTESGTGTPRAGFGPASKLRAQLVVSAASGTSPTLDVVIQDSIDGGETWFDVLTFTQAEDEATEVKNYSEVDGSTALVFGDRLRAKWTVGGTTPAFTFAVHLYAQ